MSRAAIAPPARSARALGDAKVLPFPRRRLAAPAGGGRGGGHGAGRGPRQAGAAVIVWPRRYWPRRTEEIDRAISWAWRLHCHGIIDSVEVTVRETELHIMRSWLR